jgi:hypothetical protein
MASSPKPMPVRIRRHWVWSWLQLSNVSNSRSWNSFQSSTRSSARCDPFFPDFLFSVFSRSRLISFAFVAPFPCIPPGVFERVRVVSSVRLTGPQLESPLLFRVASVMEFRFIAVRLFFIIIFSIKRLAVPHGISSIRCCLAKCTFRWDGTKKAHQILHWGMFRLKAPACATSPEVNQTRSC